MNCTSNKRRARTNFNGFMAPTLSTIFNDIMQSPINEVAEKIKPTTRPAVNISKTEEAHTLSLSTPGVKKENINIEIVERKLTVSSKSEQDTDTKFRLREFSYDNFSRTFNLPKNVAVDQISADYTDGILTLTLPIAPEAQPKSIKVN